MQRKILIVEDNPDITDILVSYFIQNNDEAIVAKDGEVAIELFNKETIDIILLDIMLPKKDGYEVLKEIRKTSNVPIIMLTAKVDEASKIMGFEYGADDYMIKPFSCKEVLLRINAVLRRINTSRDQNENVLIFDNLKIDISSYRVLVDNIAINLSKKEIDILWFLAINKNKVFSRENLLNNIWGYDYYGDMRTVDTHIKRLRSKLNIKDNYSWNIETVFGVGYKFEVQND